MYDLETLMKPGEDRAIKGSFIDAMAPAPKFSGKTVSQLAMEAINSARREEEERARREGRKIDVDSIAAGLYLAQCIIHQVQCDFLSDL